MKISFHGADLGVTGSCHLEEAEWHARKHARHGHGKKGKEAVPLYTVLFSGDLGYSGRVILRDPAPPPKADIVIMETTYGDRLHKTLQPSIEELYEAVTDTFRRGGSVIIPTFALERAQEILHYLRAGVKGC